MLNIYAFSKEVIRLITHGLHRYKKVFVGFQLYFDKCADAYSNPCHISKMEFFCENSEQL